MNDAIERTAASHPRSVCRAAVVAALLLASGGCGSQDLDTSYGTTTSRWLSTSINGVDVLAGMFADAGHEVTSRRMLITSSMTKVQTVVWFPDDHWAPGEEVCDWFDEWLAAEPNRTLIYVGRGFDAEAQYWRKTERLAPKEQQKLYRRQQRMAEVRRPRRWSSKSKEKDPLQCEWFTIEPGTRRDLGKLTGPWSQGIDSDKAEFEVSDLLLPHEDARPLLSAGDVRLVSKIERAYWDDSRVIVVTDGSFLLNLPLVNHEHRELAGKLVEAVGPAGRVVFLESGPGDPPIDPPARGSALARLFGAWPLNVILLHLAVLGIIFCFARWPIFGRPRIPPGETTSDFGMHVTAVSELLRRTHDRAYAKSKLPQNADAAKAAAAGASVPAGGKLTL